MFIVSVFMQEDPWKTHVWKKKGKGKEKKTDSSTTRRKIGFKELARWGLTNNAYSTINLQYKNEGNIITYIYDFVLQQIY